MEKLDITDIIDYIWNFLLWILMISGLVEMLLFPSWDNFMGIVVSIVSFVLYGKYIFRLDVLRKRPLCFISFSSLILFMYLPLPITLMDGNEMSHHLFNPKTTYFLQLVYFVCCIMAFNLADRYRSNFHGISVMFHKIGAFSTPSPMQLWVLGLIGWGFKLSMMSSQFTGDTLYQAGIGTLSLFAALIYAPLLIMFMPLMGGKPVNKKYKLLVGLYMLAMMLLLVATNSRSQVITPLFMIILCYLLTVLYKQQVKISRFKVISSIILLLIIVGPLSDMALAMLIARSQRQNTKFTVLLESTLDIYRDKERLYKLKSMMERTNVESKIVQTADWNENYVSSIFLNRVCNYRVVDASIYHAERAGMPNQAMMEDFLIHLMIVFPQPIVDVLFGHIDKSKYTYSPQDKLYAVSTNKQVQSGFKVGGDVGLNLSIFGILSFPIIIFVYMFEFILFDCFTCKRQGKVIISFLPLLSIYSTYFLRFMVAGGIIAHFTFLIWGFLFELMGLLIAYHVVRRVVPHM